MSQAPTATRPQEPAVAAMMGALVADAAALGLHWIYDPARIAEIAGRKGTAAFTPVRSAHYEGVQAYFAHGARARGMSSQYGECLRLAMQVMDAHGRAFDMAAYQAAYAAHFGMGGAYVGYIDKPTRAAVTNILADVVSPSGTDDTQLPALATLPAVVAVLQGQADMDSAVADAVSVTHALRRAADGAGGEMGELLRAALDAPEASSVAYGEVTGRACHLHQGLPLAFHIMARADDFADAVERNIAAGGDSCGRAIAIGAVMGAASRPMRSCSRRVRSASSG